MRRDAVPIRAHSAGPSVYVRIGVALVLLGFKGPTVASGQEGSYRTVLARVQPPDPAGEREQGLPPPMREPIDPTLPPGQPSSAVAGKSDMDLAIGESVRIRIPPEIGAFRRYVVSHDESLLILGAPVGGPEAGDARFLVVTGRRFGVFDLTLLGDQGVHSYRLRVVPGLKHVEAILLTQFPNSNVRIRQVADKILLVEGELDSVTEVEPILTLLRNLVSADGGTVINGLRIAGVMQVQLDVVIASIARSKARQLGFNFQQGNPPWYAGSQVGGMIQPPAIAPTGGAGALLPTAGGPNSPVMSGASTLFFGVAHDKESFYGYLEALQREGCFKVLANPSLVTLNGQQAQFLVGGEQPYPVPASLGQPPGIEFKNFGTELTFMPVVLGQGKLRLDVSPKVSRLDETNAVLFATTSVPRIVKQEMRVTVEMESGQTLILGGLLENQITATVQRVPLMGSLPVIGSLFRRIKHEETEQELLIMATPRLVSPYESHQRPARWPGDESRVPGDWEVYGRGQIEVPMTPCDIPRGIRSMIDAPPQAETHTEPMWAPQPTPAPPTNESP